MNQNTQLRKSLRIKRRALSSSQQSKAERQCLRHLLALPELLHAKKIGLYLDSFGEIKTCAFIDYCLRHKKNVFLPMICNMNQHLVWVPISAHQYRNRRFSSHAFGMQEPMASRGLHVSKLDLIIMPLLACDIYGTRMGMGGGFYDRTLASAPQRPYRIGLAHDFQFLSTPLNRQAWDQPIDRLITPSHCYRFKRLKYRKPE